MPWKMPVNIWTKARSECNGMSSPWPDDLAARGGRESDRNRLNCILRGPTTALDTGNRGKISGGAVPSCFFEQDFLGDRIPLLASPRAGEAASPRKMARSLLINA